MAALSGVTKANLSLMEHDQGNPTLSTLVKVAKAFGVSVAELLSGVDGMGEAAADEPLPFDVVGG